MFKLTSRQLRYQQRYVLKVFYLYFTFRYSNNELARRCHKWQNVTNTNTKQNEWKPSEFCSHCLGLHLHMYFRQKRTKEKRNKYQYWQCIDGFFYLPGILIVIDENEASAWNAWKKFILWIDCVALWIYIKIYLVAFNSMLISVH